MPPLPAGVVLSLPPAGGAPVPGFSLPSRRTSSSAASLAAAGSPPAGPMSRRGSLVLVNPGVGQEAFRWGGAASQPVGCGT
jgi:hypothetical protein